MADKTKELAIEVPVEIRQTIERAAAAQEISVSEFVERALAKFLADAGLSTKRPPTESGLTAVVLPPSTPPA